MLPIEIKAREFFHHKGKVIENLFCEVLHDRMKKYH